MEKAQEDELLKLFEELLYAVKHDNKRISNAEIPSNLIFTMLTMRTNKKSLIFSESATWVDPRHVDALLEQGMIQRTISEEQGKFALTLRGIAHCIQQRFGKSLADQFLSFLELSDQKLNTTEQVQLDWKEKLACLGLILLASTSPSSAIDLNDDANKAVLGEVFQKTLDCLKKHNIVGQENKIGTVSRGESPVSALMCRLDKLPRKTNHYYSFTGGSQYYLDIEKGNDVSRKRLSFLLKRIFEKYNPDVDYPTMCNELAEISQTYHPRFRARSTNPAVVLSILAGLRDFGQREILLMR